MASSFLSSGYGQTFGTTPEMAQTQPVVFSSDYVVQKDVKFITGKLIQLERQVFSDLLHCAAYQSLKHGVLRNGNVMAGKVFNGRIKEVSRLQPGMTQCKPGGGTEH